MNNVLEFHAVAESAAGRDHWIFQLDAAKSNAQVRPTACAAGLAH